MPAKTMIADATSITNTQPMPHCIPLAVPDLRGRESELLLNCVRENWVSSAGPQVIDFERRMAALTGRQHAVAVVNGTAGLHLSLLAAGVKPGDHVVVPDWTFAASANAVAHAGAVPHFVDVGDKDWALDAELTEVALKKDSRIMAIIAVDPLGHAADAIPLHALARRFGVALIEDAAGAIGGSYHGRPCGSLGDVSVFSFNGNKTVTAGGGGMVVCDDTAHARLIRHVSTQARPTAEYDHDMVGFNYRMTNLNAAVGIAQLERLGEMVAAKQRIARLYDTAIAGRDDLRPMPRPEHSVSSCWLYCVSVASETDAQSLVARLHGANIEARIFWRSLSAQMPWMHAPSTVRRVSRRLSGTVVSLPCSSSLSLEDQSRVIAAIGGWRGRVLQAA